MLSNPFLYWMDRIYGFFIKIGSNLQSLFLLFMRLTWGHQLLLTGVDKLRDIPGTVKLFTELHIPSPLFHAYEVGILEAVGGILLMIGFASRIISIPLIFLMVSALSLAHKEHLSNFKFIIDPHLLVAQEPYPFLITALLVFIFGPGRISLDAWIKRWVGHQPKY
jgi:putative oxidoreductase